MRRWGDEQSGPVEPVTVTAADSKGGALVEGTLASEIGQSFYLMALMALVVAVYVGLGLLAVRLLG